MYQEARFNWKNFIIGVLFIITAIISFKDPLANLVGIVMLFAIVAIVKGIMEIMFMNAMKQVGNHSSIPMLIIGILDILLGIFLFFNIGAGVITLPFIFAIWFIADSIHGLVTATYVRAISGGYFWFRVLINVLGILVGIMLLFDPISSGLTLAFLVGFYFMIIGITNLIEAFN